MQKLILSNFQSPGDIVMLTAAVRDLHLCYPKKYLTGVKTNYGQIWENNPYVTTLHAENGDIREIQCRYPLINKSNTSPYHFIHGFIDFLNTELNLHIKPTVFKGDIHLSAPEKEQPSQVFQLTGKNTPFWLIVSGGKYDFTTKWWDAGRYQQVVDFFKGRIQFVQVGEKEHYHPPLKNVIDLRGSTDIRQLINLVYHAQGMVTPVSLLMHLAAAVETKPSNPGMRPCVVVAGGREPVQWEAYPAHQYIHTMGALACCATGGCWKARVKRLNDGSEHDRPENLCVDVIGNLPRCMDIIKAEDVINRIELYFNNNYIQYLKQDARRKKKPAAHEITRVNGKIPAAPAAAVPYSDMIVPPQQVQPATEYALTSANAREMSERFIRTIPAYPGGYRDQGIIICAGGIRLFTSAWVCIKILRHLGCTLPVQLWHLGEGEMDAQMRALVKPLGVECVDGMAIRKYFPARILNGWELKAYAILHSTFKEVLLLDADNVPVMNCQTLFDTKEYRATGAIFWPDLGRLEPGRLIWNLCGVPYHDEPEFESGQIVVNKETCWRPLNLAMWYNEYSDFYYQYVHGDKETFHLAFNKLFVPYSMMPYPVKLHHGTLYQHDFSGKVIFQHRNGPKWNYNADNPRLPGFQFEDMCFEFLNELKSKWNGIIRKDTGNGSPKVKEAVQAFVSKTYQYKRIGHDERPMTFSPEGKIHVGKAECEQFWNIYEESNQLLLEIYSEKARTCVLSRGSDDVWRGNWLIFEKMPIELAPK